MYFPLFLPLWEKQGNFFIAPQPYPRALRKSAWLPLWRGRKHSLWYAHRSDPTAPAHPLPVPHLSEDWWCRGVLKCGSESLPTPESSGWHSCKHFLLCLEVPNARPTSNIQRRFPYKPVVHPVCHQDCNIHNAHDSFPEPLCNSFCGTTVPITSNSCVLSTLQKAKSYLSCKYPIS